MRNFVLALLVVATLTACGGGSSDDNSSAPITPTPETTPTGEITPTPEATPTGEITPTPETTPTGEITPTPEATPTGEITPTPETTPTGETTPMPEATPTGEITPTPVTTPTVEITPTPKITPSPEVTVTPTPVAVPAGGVSIINTNAADAGVWGGDNNGAPVGARTVVDVTHEAFDQANRITVTNPKGEYWNGQLFFPTITDLNANDKLLVHFYLRSVENTYETGSSFTTVFVEDADYNKYVVREVTAAADWVEYFIPVEITSAEAKSQLALRFGFGAGDRAQTFDIGGVELLNFGSTVSLDDLPVSLPSYDGREDDAPWRAEAAARIEQYRKGDFELNIVDGDGNPVANATVEVRFKQHAYHFGSVTVGHLLADSSADGVMYRSKVLELFNQSGPENDLKWAPWEGEWGASFAKQQTLDGLQWLRDNGIYTRGHVMVWPSKRNLPKLIQDYLPEDSANADPAAKQVVLDHIDDIATATASYLDEWDVLNEPYDNHYLMDAFGDQVMVDWFNRARQNLPSHGLYINDYSILSSQGRDFAHQQDYEDNIRFLVEQNAPIDGIGLQSHFSETPTAIPTVYDIVDRFAKAFPGLDIRSTEFDVSTDYEDLQADYTRDFLTIFFSHPATVGVQCWGFWAKAHWRPSAAMYDEDWREKPNALVWKDLIYNQWWSDFDGTTNAQGQYRNRGFYGRYQVTVTLGEQTKTFDFSLEAGQDNVFNVAL